MARAVVGPLEAYVRDNLPNLIPKLPDIVGAVRDALTAGLKEVLADVGKLPALVADVKKALEGLRIPGVEQLAGVVFEALKAEVDPLFQDLFTRTLGVAQGATSLVDRAAKGFVSAVVGHLDAHFGPWGPPIRAGFYSYALQGGSAEEVWRAALEADSLAVQIIGHLLDMIIRKDLLFSPDLTLEEIIAYQEFLLGFQALWIAISLAFSAVVDVLSLGQARTVVGVFIHFVDEHVIGFAHTTVSRVLFRRALADPLEVGMARIHRHKDLSGAEAEQAFVQGFIDHEGYGEVLAREGFKNEAIAIKKLLAGQKQLEVLGQAHARVKGLSTPQALEALAHGILDEEEVRVALGLQGLTPAAVDVLVRLEQAKVARGRAPKGG